MRNLVKTTKESKVEVIKSAKGVLKLRFLGVGYGDKDNRDLDGEFFTEKTDFSDDFIPIIGLNYDHLPYWSDNPFASRVLKSKLLGSAKFVESTEEGRWYEAEVAKAESYQNYIAMLAEKGYLGASTQAMPGSVTVLATGEIVDWAETGMALTVRPANSDTLNTINEMAKSFSIPLYPEIKKSMEDQAVAEALAKQKAEEEAAAAKTKPDEDDSAEGGDDETPVTEITIDTEGLVEDVKTAATAAIAEAMEAPLTAINNIVTTLTEAVDGIKGLTDDENFKSFIADFSKNLAENNRQLKAVTFVVANVMKTKVNGGVEIPFPTIKTPPSSEEGQDAGEEESAKSSSLPVGFPGNA